MIWHLSSFFNVDIYSYTFPSEHSSGEWKTGRGKVFSRVMIKSQPFSRPLSRVCDLHKFTYSFFFFFPSSISTSLFLFLSFFLLLHIVGVTGRLELGNFYVPVSLTPYCVLSTYSHRFAYVLRKLTSGWLLVSVWMPRILADACRADRTTSRGDAVQ